ncbi:MAG: ribbon-helix-helix protein, CopG family [Haloferacaceae archaeon]
MGDGGLDMDMDQVTLELDEETIEALDDIAWTDHRGNREAAIRDLLDEWLRDRDRDRDR